MKNFVSIAVMVTLVASGASASFAMMSSDSSMSLDSSMMKKDAMMKDEKMKMADDTKMMAKKYTRMTTSALAKSMGYTWSSDRFTLAEKAGITGYRGTIHQNLTIRTYLMGMMKDVVQK